MATSAAQIPLPLAPEGAVQIGEATFVPTDAHDGHLWLLGRLWWSWQAGDEAGRRMAAVQLAESGTAPTHRHRPSVRDHPRDVVAVASDLRPRRHRRARTVQARTQESTEAHRRGHQPHRRPPRRGAHPGPHRIRRAAEGRPRTPRTPLTGVHPGDVPAPAARDG